MPITRLALETALIDRAGALMSLCGKNIAANGSNANLTDSIGFALQFFGTAVTSPGVVTDADLSTVKPSLYFGILDLAEYRLISSCLTGFVEPNQAVSLGRQDLNDLMLRFQNRAKDLMAILKTEYGFGLGTLVGGNIKLGPDAWHRGRRSRCGGDL